MFNLKIHAGGNSDSLKLADNVRNIALGIGNHSFLPYHCFIEYKKKDEVTGIEYRDCTVDHSRCSNQNCIKKLV